MLNILKMALGARNTAAPHLETETMTHSKESSCLMSTCEDDERGLIIEKHNPVRDAQMALKESDAKVIKARNDLSELIEKLARADDRDAILRLVEAGVVMDACNMAEAHGDLHRVRLLTNCGAFGGCNPLATSLHNLDQLSPRAVFALLRNGANYNARARIRTRAPSPSSVIGLDICNKYELFDRPSEHPQNPSPLELAHALNRHLQAPPGSPVWLVLQAAKPWSKATHALFPLHGRRHATALATIGSLIARSGRFAGSERSMVKIWQEHVMPHVISRAFGGCGLGIF